VERPNFNQFAAKFLGAAVSRFSCVEDKYLAKLGEMAWRGNTETKKNLRFVSFQLKIKFAFRA
jgi:hypothetical protein